MSDETRSMTRIYEFTAEELAEHDAHVRAEALTQAADAWTQGQWADAPRRADRVQERLANAQFVGDWLRDRAARIAREGGDHG